MPIADGIATSVAARQGRVNVQRMQQRLAEATSEVSTGRKADVAGELGGRTGGLLLLRSAYGRVERYAQTSSAMTTRLEVMQESLGDVRKAAEGVALPTLSAIGIGDNTSLRFVRENARNALATVTQRLNVSVAGRSLFAGARTDAPPLIEPDAGPAAVASGLVDDAAGGGAVDTAGVAGLVAAFDRAFDDTHADPATRFSTAFYQGAPAGAPDVAGQLDEATRLTYGVKAADPGFRDVLQGLHMLASVDYGDPRLTNDAYRAFAGEAVARVQRGLGRVLDVAAATGQKQAVVAANQESLDAAKATYNNRIVDLEGRDPYEAATALQAMQQQLEASYAVTARLANLSLTRYLA